MRRVACMGLIVVGLVCQMFLAVLADATPPVAVVRAAQEGIKTFAKMSPLRGAETNAGGALALGNASLGEGFQVFTIPPVRLLGSSQSDSFEALVVPSTIWEFLVMTRGKATAVLTVDRVNDTWTAVSFGKAGLAQQLEAVLKVWSAGYQLRLVRVYQATSDFIEVASEGNVLGVVPLTSAKVALDLKQESFNPADLQNDRALVKKLIPIVREKLLKSN